ncbi:hypothetical protein EDC50_2286 [Vulcaniibacterium tengchongense]|uniref:DUF1680 family protein n=1 Tax=Vulcaniibacterium tengchongense TaxID=1273429 RepID=A0A3N4V4Q8_9GAMM|nr:hypothetical protein EDC50_2286 [Vulcaniibacterium tengchongense]
MTNEGERVKSNEERGNGRDGERGGAVPRPAGLRPPLPRQVELHGPLGDALAANLRGRLSRFIVDETSPAIALFAPERVRGNHEGDWYGEHAGKWLYAAAKAAARSGDAALAASVRRVADYLVSRQDEDGYLGNYAPERRFMRKQPPKPVSWNGEPALRTWDVWTHSYLVLGLLEAHRHIPEPRYLQAARRIGDLCLRTLDGGIAITELGNHFGMSATVLMEPAVELYFATGERRYLDLAERVLAQADAEPQLALLRRALAGADASEIATGKAYQLIWNLVGVLKLHRATGKPEYREAVERLWGNIREHHLSLGGGPWGGVAHRSREVFNAPGAFVPQGYIETCSVLAWLQLNRELLALTGHARYAEEIERTAYNDLIGAQAPDGEDWCYYSYANGKRVHTTYWRCCKSSGAMALEELPGVAYAADEAGVRVHLYGPGTAQLETAQAGAVELRQRTRYPFDGAVRIEVAPARPARFVVALRLPAWAEGFQPRVNGTPVPAEAGDDGYLRVAREWRAGDAIEFDLPLRPRLHRRTHRNVQESRAPDGAPVAQEVLRYDYAAISRGALVYAVGGLIDGYKTEETVKLPQAPCEAWIEPLADAGEGADLLLHAEGRPPLRLQPYYRAGGRAHGAWRFVWLPLPPEDAR